MADRLRNNTRQAITRIRCDTKSVQRHRQQQQHSLLLAVTDVELRGDLGPVAVAGEEALGVRRGHDDVVVVVVVHGGKDVEGRRGGGHRAGHANDRALGPGDAGGGRLGQDLRNIWRLGSAALALLLAHWPPVKTSAGLNPNG